MALCGVAALLVLLIVGVVVLTGRGGDAPVSAAQSAEDEGLTITRKKKTPEATQPPETPEAEPVQAQSAAAFTDEAAPTEAPKAASSPYSFRVTPTGDSWKSGKYAPEPQGPGYLPVFKSAGRDDKVIAITVDDCFQTENLKQIIQLAEDVSGKLTIFPIGELLKREALQEVIKYAYSIGFEIENHTWSHDGLYNLTDEELAKHIFDQDRAVDYVLGVNYKTHFLRPRGGDDRNDLRTHSYIAQLGYYGIAHWSASGGANLDAIKSALAPGTVYLFHCTDKDLEKLKAFIPYADTQGYKLITMNEMFGYPDNETELLTDDPMSRQIIPLEPYTPDYKTLQPTAYDYAAYLVQKALIEQGYLTGEPDGVYGNGTAACVAKWQQANGYNPDGIMTAEQQKKLLGVE